MSPWMKPNSHTIIMSITNTMKMMGIMREMAMNSLT